MERRRRNWYYLFAGGAAAAAAGLWLWLGTGRDVGYRTARLERGEIEAAVSATGSCNAVVTVQVGSLVSGNIKELHADFNTKVQKGQLVARIDPELFQARVNQARASLDAARASAINAQASEKRAEADAAASLANVESAKANVAKARVAVLDADNKLKRRVELARQGILSREERDTAQAAYDSAVASLEAARSQQAAAESSYQAAIAGKDAARTLLLQSQAQVRQVSAGVRQAEVDLEHTEIRAPVDGVVVARRMDVGQTVAASFQAPTLFEIAQDLTKMQVNTNVDEADIGRVRPGQQASFTVDAYPGQSFHGGVVEIRKAPNAVQNVVTYDVVVGVANPDLKLFPGMTANVKIVSDRRENVLRLPNAALRFRPAGPRGGPGAVQAAGRPEKSPGQVVWVLRDRIAVPVRLKLGITDGSFSEVASGDLKEGDAVIVGLESGQAARPGAGRTQGLGGRRGPGF